jgi:membrane associated rhomboid family serine protease
VGLLYFLPGIAAQVANAWWSPEGGGSSTAVFGVMGALLAYVVRNRARPMVRAPFVAIACVALGTAVVTMLSHDGHGVGVLVGALASLLLRPSPIGDGPGTGAPGVPVTGIHVSPPVRPDAAKDGTLSL